MPSTDVVITHHERIEEAIPAALKHVPLASLVHGKRVAVKPNETWASEDDTTGITQPDTLRAVLQAIKRHQPRELIVTGGAGAAETDEVFRIGGLMDVVEAEGAEFVDHNRAPFVSIELEYRPSAEVEGPQATVMVNSRVLEYDALIALNQLKLHETATVTLALKNIAMSFPAADYYGHPRSTEKHANDFFADMHSFIAAMAKRFPIDLAITVGHPAMIGTGPLGGHTFETGIVIASTDALAADVVGARLLGFTTQAVDISGKPAGLGWARATSIGCGFRRCHCARRLACSLRPRTAGVSISSTHSRRTEQNVEETEHLKAARVLNTGDSRSARASQSRPRDSRPTESRPGHRAHDVARERAIN